MIRESRALSVAVIGAGLAGLTAARHLVELGHTVRVFYKGRGAGGRMSTRRQYGHEFDHGAQFFTARNESFRSAVGKWRSSPWARITSTMRSLASALAAIGVRGSGGGRVLERTTVGQPSSGRPTPVVPH